MTSNERPYRHPLLWVPSSYFVMGTVWVTVTTMSNIMFLNLGLSVAQAASYSSLLGLPYVFKPLWAPLLELYKTKKFWVVACQLVLSATLAATAFALPLPNQTFVAPVLGLLMLAGLVGATMDIGSDGVYVTTLPAKEQARYTGFQSMCWSIGPIVATGLFVWITGKLHETMSYAWAWLMVFVALAALLLVASFVHMKTLPAGAKAADAPESAAEAMKTFGVAFVSFFQKRAILAMVAFAFLYRFGLGLLDKIGPAFLIDSRLAGGLGLNNEQLGILNGGVGTAAFILGSLLGGLFVARSKSGLLGVLFVLALSLNVPNLTFLYLGVAMPSNTDMGGLYLVGTLVFIEKFGWGFGAVGHMLYMMQQIAPGPYKTAHYAFATGLMGLCMTATGLISGWIVEAVGYRAFFWTVLAAAAPSLIATLTAPFIHAEGDPANDGKKRFVLAEPKRTIAIIAVLAVSGIAGFFVFQRGSEYDQRREALRADTAACFESDDRQACYFQCELNKDPKACLRLSQAFATESPLLSKAQMDSLEGDARREHQYLRSQAYKWYRKYLEQTCDAAAGNTEGLAACLELGQILSRPKSPEGIAVDDPCAPRLNLSDARARWCDVAAPDEDQARNWFTKACARGKGIEQACELED